MPDFQTGVLLGKIRDTQLQTLYEVREIRRAMNKDRVPRIESWLKSFLTIAAPTATLFATGSVSKAMDVLSLIVGR